MPTAVPLQLIAASEGADAGSGKLRLGPKAIESLPKGVALGHHVFVRTPTKVRMKCT